MAEYYVSGKEVEFGDTSLYFFSLLKVCSEGTETRFGYKVCSAKQSDDYAVALGCKSALFWSFESGEKECLLHRYKAKKMKRMSCFTTMSNHFEKYSFFVKEKVLSMHLFTDVEELTLIENDKNLEMYIHSFSFLDLEMLKKELRLFLREYNQSKLNTISSLLKNMPDRTETVLDRIMDMKRKTFLQYVNLLHQIEETKLSAPLACKLYRELKEVKIKLDSYSKLERVADEVVWYMKTPVFMTNNLDSSEVRQYA